MFFWSGQIEVVIEYPCRWDNPFHITHTLLWSVVIKVSIIAALNEPDSDDTVMHRRV